MGFWASLPVRARPGRPAFGLRLAQSLGLVPGFDTPYLGSEYKGLPRELYPQAQACAGSRRRRCGRGSSGGWLWSRYPRLLRALDATVTLHSFLRLLRLA